MDALQTIKRRFGIIGRSKSLDRALSTAIRVAKTDLTVLITGESGVGKEAFSKIIHQLSVRKHEKFIAINCGAIPEGTINSELFGHDKGAFTGATGDRKGYFETVNGGTIFLDEIGEMPLDTQSFLLRILESGEFLRVGSSKVLTTDVRIVAATNVNLMQKIEEGKFREDLYYRLNTVPIYVPPLRNRKEDIYLLFRKFTLDFAEKYGSKTVDLKDDALELLENYHWKGNIRELKNVAEQLSVLSIKDEINAEDLSQILQYSKGDLLPSKTQSKSGQLSYEEREIFYKFLLDMKTDLNDLKDFVYRMARHTDLEMPSFNNGNYLPPAIQDYNATFDNITESPPPKAMNTPNGNTSDSNEHVPDSYLSQDVKDTYDESEIIEENLSLEDMERELIKKALIKHRNKRKEAALELGISERTLYRKIKQYDLN